MKKPLTPRQLREEIEAIDRDLERLQPWEKKLTAARKRYLLDDDRYVVKLIEDGLSPGQGRPPNLGLDELDWGWPGLDDTRQTIAELKERRAILVEQRPSKSETEVQAKDAETRAADIRTRSDRFAEQCGALDEALRKLAPLVASIVEESRRLREDCHALDKLTRDADIPRPETTAADALAVPIATQLSHVLRGYLQGTQAA